MKKNIKINIARMELILKNIEKSNETILYEYRKLSQFLADLKDVYDANCLSAISYDSIMSSKTNVLHDTFDVIERNNVKYKELIRETSTNIYLLNEINDEYSRTKICLIILSSVYGKYYNILELLLVKNQKINTILDELEISKNTLKKYKLQALEIMCKIYNLESNNENLYDYAREHLEEWMEARE